MAKKLNILEQKQSNLQALESRTHGLINMVTETIESLASANHDIDSEIADIEGYQRSLSETRNGLLAAKRQNDTIITNFRTLIGAN